MLGLAYEPAEWPHGLRCIDCWAVFTLGMRYSSRLESFTDGDVAAEDSFDRPIPITHIICVACALTGEPA